MQINILGKTFKAESNLTLGSPSILLKNILDEENINCNIWDPYLDCNLDEAIDKFSWKNQIYFS